MMGLEAARIPNGWAQTSLEAVCQILDSRRIPLNSSERSRRIAGKSADDLYPYYGATGQVGVIDDFIFDGEHVLLGEDGAPFLDPFKVKSYLVGGKFWVNNHAHILKAAISNRYLSRYLNQIDYSDYVTGTTRLKLTQNALKRIPVLVAPTAEQHRIVAKIEELFSELDKGIESLKTARAQLKVYRQALLKHAFEGKLTAQWREENKDKLEKPERLLARIKQEREARYELQRKEWAAAVKKWEESGGLERKPSSPRPPSFPEPFTDIELMAWPEIFGLWRWVKVGELFSVYVGATPSRKNRSYWNGAINWISSGEVRFAPINKTNETVTPEGLASASTEIHPIGTVMLAMIGEGKTRGQAAVTHVEACHNQNTAAIRVSESEISPEYVYYYLLYRYEDTRRVGSGNNQKALNKERVSNLPIPLPSLDEQAVVVQELKKLLSAIEQLDREICNQLTSASALRQSILKKAFTGQLVAQDPNDEPASVLLDRIRTEREKAVKNNHAKKTKKRKAAA